jgi:hypothetical protein
MIKLIVLEGEFPVFNPELRMILPFKAIIDRNKNKKGFASKELAFIYFFADPRSSYVESYQDLDIREEKIKVLLGLPESWKKDSLIDEAIEFYLEEIKDDFDYKYLNSNIIAAEKTIKYLENVDYSARDNKGNLLYKPADVVKVIKESGSVIESLKTLREKIFKKTSLTTKIRGGGDVGMFERP